MSTSPLISAAASADQYLTTLRDGWAQAMQQWVDQSSSAWDQWSRWSVAPDQHDHRHHEHGHHHHEHERDHEHRHEHGCCSCCGDACACCVPEADVVVQARAGEVRVVPFRLSNHWRREREVILAVGPWHVCGGQKLEIRGVLDDEKVVLAPCEDKVVTLRVSVGADAEECVSAYADVRFEGCGRPVRIAVVVSPGSCDAVDICCDCGCCC